MIETYRAAVAAHVAGERHIRECGREAKTLNQIARELGTSKNTVRRWLRRDHWDLWMEHWASVEEIWDAAQRDREQSPRDQRKRLANEQRKGELKAALDRSLARLLAEAHETFG